MKKYKIAVVGATGAVGQEMFQLLSERNFPIETIVPFASEKNEGKKIHFQNQDGKKEFICKKLELNCFKNIDLAFFDASDEVSKKWVPIALQAGVRVIDHSAAFRMDSKIPLIVPEINGSLIQNQKMVSGPNCTTSQLVMALKPLHDEFKLTRVYVSTYQSVSGAGAQAIEELQNQIKNPESPPPQALIHPIAFNLIPQIGSFDEEGHTSEEKKVMQETQKILGLPELKISCTAVRVPTLRGHAESVFAEFKKNPDLDRARTSLTRFPGVVVQDDPRNSIYPMNQTAFQKNPVFVGRLRKDPANENGLLFWVVSDNLRKGAALNAIQIAERMISE